MLEALSARRSLGPVNESAINPACNKPYGGLLLKWNWGSSSFRPVPGVTGAGYRITIMPETHMPWIVDSCGQLSGWTPSLKRMYGPAPQGRMYDITAVNNTGDERLAVHIQNDELLSEYRWSVLTLPSASSRVAVFSGCSSYNLGTFGGDIAAGCDLSVEVGPNRTLLASDYGDLAVAADGSELVAADQYVFHKHANLGGRW